LYNISYLGMRFIWYGNENCPQLERIVYRMKLSHEDMVPNKLEGILWRNIISLKKTEIIKYKYTNIQYTTFGYGTYGIFSFLKNILE
jgi:hypothetical protein